LERSSDPALGVGVWIRAGSEIGAPTQRRKGAQNSGNPLSLEGAEPGAFPREQTLL